MRLYSITMIVGTYWAQHLVLPPALDLDDPEVGGITLSDPELDDPASSLYSTRRYSATYRSWFFYTWAWQCSYQRSMVSFCTAVCSSSYPSMKSPSYSFIGWPYCPMSFSYSYCASVFKHAILIERRKGNGIHKAILISEHLEDMNITWRRKNWMLEYMILERS